MQQIFNLLQRRIII